MGGRTAIKVWIGSEVIPKSGADGKGAQAPKSAL